MHMEASGQDGTDEHFGYIGLHAKWLLSIGPEWQCGEGDADIEKQ